MCRTQPYSWLQYGKAGFGHSPSCLGFWTHVDACICLSVVAAAAAPVADSKRHVVVRSRTSTAGRLTMPTRSEGHPSGWYMRHVCSTTRITYSLKAIAAEGVCVASSAGRSGYLANHDDALTYCWHVCVVGGKQMLFFMSNGATVNFQNHIACCL